MTGLSDKQADRMRLALQAHDAQKADDARAADLEFIKDILAVVESPEYAGLEETLKSLRAQYMDDHNIFAQLNCILTAMPNLAFEIARRSNS